MTMDNDRISELRALCAEYKRKREACEAAGLKEKAADIAADGVGRKALEALPELVQRISELSVTVTVMGLMALESEDYRDAAEFEARVAEKMATVICGECEDLDKKNVCPLTIYQAHGIEACRLKHARLTVEREMIAEGKGPGRPEE